MSEYFFPILTAVEALAPYRLCTTWSTGETLDVDVEGVLRRHALTDTGLRPELIPETCPWALGQVMDLDFLPE